MAAVRMSAVRAGRFLELISEREKGVVNLRAIVLLEGLGQLKKIIQ
jgi:hypothetical protein